MSTFRFAAPGWFHAMWLVAALALLLLWLEWRRGDLLSKLLSNTMQARLVHGLSPARRRLSIGLVVLAATFLVVALMRPQWGLTYHSMPRVGAQIMVCLDVSKSMLAEDTAPNRLERAKADLTDLLSYLDGDQVGLIAFAGRATVLCPLTPDYGFFKLILDAAGPHSVGRGGTRLEEPIRKALKGFRSAADISRVILLITDGEDLDSHPLDAARNAAEQGVKILTIGFGAESGSEIRFTDPLSGATTVVRDAGGTPVVSRLDGDLLRQIALETDAAYVPAGTGALDLQSIYNAHIAPLVRGTQESRGHAIRREGYQWAILGGLLLLVMSVLVGSSAAQSTPQRRVRKAQPARRVTAAATAMLTALQVTASAQIPQEPQQGNPPRLCFRTPQQSRSGPNMVVSSQDWLPNHSSITEPSTTTDKVTASEGVDGRTAAKMTDRPEQTTPATDSDPRDDYNRALAYLDSDADRAERLLTNARRSAGTDGQLRFRATYNLGWVEVKRANAQLAEKPEEALVHLRRAADWFRDAVRLRGESRDARHNLELVLRRIVQLADSLAQKDKRGLPRRLDDLIATQRTLLTTTRHLVQRVTADQDPNLVDRLRSDFRRLDAQQRKLLADSQAVARTAREQYDAILDKANPDKTDQDHVRAAQLNALLHYTNRATQRMGQARSQMRLRQAERAFRRAAAALDELKRARDQLRNPVEVLDVIIADALPIAQLTSLQASATGPPIVAATPRADLPDWLTGEYLQERQQSVTQRTTELVAQLQAALQQQATPPAGPATAEEQQAAAATDQLLAMARTAMPLLNQGKESFETADQALATEQFSLASRNQLAAIAALRTARQQFLQLRGLIELVYAREMEIETLLPRLGQEREEEQEREQGQGVEQEQEQEQEQGKGEKAAERLEGKLEIALSLQAENLERSRRIAALLKARIAHQSPTPASSEDASAQAAPADAAAEQQAAAERQRLVLATQMLDLAQKEMTAAVASLSTSRRDLNPAQPPAASTDDEAAKTGSGQADIARTPSAEDGGATAASREHIGRAIEHLQALRRLFFSTVEHLRETAQRQAQLNDETEKVTALQHDAEVAKTAAPLALRQQQLHKAAATIAKALDEQAQQQKQPPKGASIPQNVAPQQLAQHRQVSEQLAKAATLVDDAAKEMAVAGHALANQQQAILEQVRAHQDEALKRLAAALAILQPQQPNDQNKQNQEKQDQQSDQEQQQGKGQQKQPPPAQRGTDPARLLQVIRDREAQRRRAQKQRGRMEQDPVNKDW